MKLLQPWLGEHMAPRTAWLQAEGTQIYTYPPTSKPQLRAEISHASFKKKKVNHNQVSAHGYLEHPAKRCSGSKAGWEQADAAGRSTSASWHPLLPAPQSLLVGLLARHVNKTFNFRKFSSLGLLTLDDCCAKY